MKIDWFKNKTKLFSAAVVCTLLATNATAQESNVSVPWENIVKADDTAVFWVLACFSVLLLLLIWVVVGVTKGLLADKELWKGKWGASAKAVALLIGGSLFASSSAFAASTGTVEPTSMFQMSDGLFWIMILVNVFLLLVLFGMLYNLSSLIKSLRSKDEAVATAPASAPESIWEGSLSGAVPLEKERDILMDHEYDGIRELDNKLPPWWLYMYYATIVFGVIYLIHFEVAPIPGLDKLTLLGPVGKGTNADMYIEEMALAEEEKAVFLASSANNVDENSVVLLTDAAAIENGKAKFDMLCIACHAKTAGSTEMPPGVGPNLTDEYWLHGGGIKNIFKTIKYGVPAKGMISWENQLTPVQLQEVASYIVSLEGTNPENAKAPQGDVWVEE